MQRSFLARLCASPFAFLLACLGFFQSQAAEPAQSIAGVRVSPRDARYFELTDGRPYIPIGLNMIAPPGNRFEGMEEWLDLLHQNGGNYIRIWMSNPFFDVEHQKSGVYDEAKAARIAQLLDAAARRGIRVKMCIESFRHLGTQNQPWSAKPLHLATHGGPATSIADFFDGRHSRDQFKRKLAWFAPRFADHPAIFGWELWNEINAVAGGDYMAWTEEMLPELRRLFPKHLAMQSLGSFDTERVDALYRRLALMPGNDVAQVHRYLDLGASLEICKAPMDELASEAVRRLLRHNPKRPVLLAEGGAVEPRHSGPFKLYAQDKAGMLLHDVLFAPFFSGAAGPGHIWHWDHYVARMNLWRHFGRFAEAVKDLDPAAARLEPGFHQENSLRCYFLKGTSESLVWLRDGLNTWQTELVEGTSPAILHDRSIQVDRIGFPRSLKRLNAFDPWTGAWSEAVVKEGVVTLPNFSRSLVLRGRFDP